MVQMKTKDKTYQEELLKKLFASPDLKRERQLLSQLFGQPVFWIASLANKTHAVDAKPFCAQAQANKNKKKKCLQQFNQVLNRAKKTGQLEKFLCREHGLGICLPLIHGDACYGFLIVCHLKNMPSKQSLSLFKALNRTILEKIQKELELSKLYQTIRPRAIALSTIHTIHRLISSSLDLDELLPRIARLSLQILRARRCLISLVDKKSKRLILKASVDLSKKKNGLHISKKMRRIEKRAISTGNILLKNTLLSVPLIDEEPIGVITVSDKMNKQAFDDFDQEILIALSEQSVGAIRNAQLYKEQENMLLGTVKSLSTLLRARSAYPYAHSKAFVDIVLSVAKQLHLSEEKLRDLRFAAMLHDAGEIGIPAQILKKPAHLTGKELEIVKQHPKNSVKILSPLQRLKGAIAIIMHHHEKFNGTGYPDKLKGEKIPLGARIMAIADSFEAMISRRPYRKSTSISEAVKEIKRLSGEQFDPGVIKAFLQLAKKNSFKKLLKDAYRGRA